MSSVKALSFNPPDELIKRLISLCITWLFISLYFTIKHVLVVRIVLVSNLTVIVLPENAFDIMDKLSHLIDFASTVVT